jgi:hypothetical protein
VAVFTQVPFSGPNLRTSAAAERKSALLLITLLPGSMDVKQKALPCMNSDPWDEAIDDLGDGVVYQIYGDDAMSNTAL